MFLPTFMTIEHRKNAPPLGCHVFQSTGTIFKLVQGIIGTNLLTRFHDDRKINVASRKMPRPLGRHVFKPTGTIFKLIQDIIGMNLLNKFNEDRTINVALSEKCPAPWQPCFSSKHKEYGLLLTRKNAPPPGGHVFKATGTIFKLVHDIIGTNLQTKVLTRFCDSHIKKNAPPTGSHVFQPTGIIFELVHDIIGINLLTKKYAPPLGGHTNLLTKFYEDWTINVLLSPYKKNAPPPGGHVFQPTGIIFELVQDIIGMNLLTKFHEDLTINVASIVFTRKNAPPPGSHVFQANNLLTKFYDDWTINVASRVLTRQMLTTHDGQKLCSGHVFQ
ncbi:hypothetical protein DPMN_011113 [Dreissena polymorpha]|uniref:Uncharacterized protein n=1 Tax=Dreissena polymorpha TaxID=45954 RepID=A0A9D4S1L9_DREPO|nr:hypothetical protein DPMN_011113 [Dreissena polymorpha]